LAAYTPNNKKNKYNTAARKTVGIGFIAVSLLLLLFTTTDWLYFLKSFFLGTFGIMLYPILLLFILIGAGLLTNRHFVHAKKYPVYLALSFLCIIAMIHVAVTAGFDNTSYASYLTDCYNYGGLTAGGLIIGIFTYAITGLLSAAAAYVFFSIVLIVLIALIIDYLYAVKQYAKLNNVTVVPLEAEKPVNAEPLKININYDDLPGVQEAAKPEGSGNSLKAARERLGLGRTEGGREDGVKKFMTLDEKKEYIKSSDVLFTETSSSFINTAKPNNTAEWLNRGVESKTEPPKPPKFVHSEDLDEQPENAKNIIENRGKEYINSLYNANNSSPIISGEPESKIEPITPRPVFNPHTGSFEADIISSVEDITPGSDNNNTTSIEDSLNKQFIIPEKVKKKEPNAVQVSMLGAEKEKSQPQKPKYIKPSNYHKPPIDLLPVLETNVAEYEFQQQQNIEKLETVLNQFGIAAKVIAVRRGPAVTRYEISMPMGVTVKKILAHHLDISLALAAPGKIRIEAPIVGKNAVGIEIPNQGVDAVGIRDIIDSEKFRLSPSLLAFAVGKDIDGTVYVGDITKMPHLLIAGSTGSGKSVALNAMLISLLYKTGPEDLKFIIVDPKRVEFNMFSDLPHMLIPKAITDTTKAINALNWLINEMERRYMVFQECYVKNLTEYNSQQQVQSRLLEKMPYILLVVDEFGDLMAGGARKDFEEKIIKLTQKARAAGIHIVLATQRPSVDVITGTIKINLPSRMAFAVKTFEDSKTILGTGGADKLLGKGDMLYSFNNADPVRVQGAFIDTPEIAAVINYVKTHNESNFDNGLEETIVNFGVKEESSDDDSGGGSGNNDGGFDILMKDALRLVIESGQASISMLQRRFSIGFSRAARIIDQMEIAKFISPADGSKVRTVRITMEEYNGLYGGEGSGQ